MSGRNFTKSQKVALYYLARGRCQLCGQSLPNDWHADHIIPYSLGGITDVINGQALCPECNLRKGYQGMIHQWPSRYELRNWQEQFLTNYITHDQKDFLLVATPGAGKTIGSLRAAHYALNSAIIERIVVVCPTDHLRTQWLEDAAQVNIHLDKLQTGWSGQIALTTDFNGLVTTYAQAASRKEELRAFTSRHKTLVIFDEIHHCADEENLSWGPAILHSFDLATKRLLLSGTPFRSDNNKIPFVVYKRSEQNPAIQEAVANYSYGYGDALKDESVVRHIVFPSWDGDLVWENFGTKRQATFKDDLNKTDAGHRLLTAIQADGDWMRKVIAAANEKLNLIRQHGHKNAGGLIVTQDKEMAVKIANLLNELTGEKCVLVTSDIDTASNDIKKFRRSTQKWIVAVKMISEGVDIKRLRVGIYATNILTRTFFRQVIGRVIRWDSEWDSLDDQTAWFYIPEDPRLVEFASEIKTEITDVIKDQEASDKLRERNNGRRDDIETLQEVLTTYEFVRSEGEESNHYFSGEKIALDELTEAEKVFKEAPGFERIPAATKALFLRRYPTSNQPKDTGGTTTAEPYIVPKQVKRENLKTVIRKKVGRLVWSCQENRIPIPGSNPYQTVNNAWGRINNYSHSASNDDLERKLTWLEDLIQKALMGDRSIARIFSDER